MPWDKLPAYSGAAVPLPQASGGSRKFGPRGCCGPSRSEVARAAPLACGRGLARGWRRADLHRRQSQGPCRLARVRSEERAVGTVRRGSLEAVSRGRRSGVRPQAVEEPEEERRREDRGHEEELLPEAVARTEQLVVRVHLRHLRVQGL